MRNSTRFAAAAVGLLLLPALRPLEAQGSKSRADSKPEKAPVETRRFPNTWSLYPGGDSRAVIGVTLGASGRSDTLGVLVDEVTDGGPADKAGVKEGARITAINGVSLKLSPSDAEDWDLAGLGQRRLQRTLAKARPGDEVELRLAESGQARTVRVKTVSASDLNAEMPRQTLSDLRTGNDKRGALGLSIGSSGSVRDTLGLFVSSVNADGPAEKAGVIEGDRIAAINGVDVRVPHEDSEDAQASSARVNRFMRELAKVAPGDKVTLKVTTAGRTREVQVTAGKASELSRNGFQFNMGDGPMVFSMPRGSMPSIAPQGGNWRVVPPGRVFQFDGPQGRVRVDQENMDFDSDAVRKAMDEVRARMNDLNLNLPGMVRIQPGTMLPSRIKASAPIRTVPAVPAGAVRRRLVVI